MDYKYMVFAAVIFVLINVVFLCGILSAIKKQKATITIEKTKDDKIQLAVEGVDSVIVKGGDVTLKDDIENLNMLGGNLYFLANEVNMSNRFPGSPSPKKVLLNEEAAKLSDIITVKQCKEKVSLSEKLMKQAYPETFK